MHHHIYNQMEITHELVSELILQTTSEYDPLSAELEQFYKFLIISHVEYKPLKIVTLRRRLLLTKETLFRNRKRILKYLVLGYLRQEGYCRSSETFEEEAAVTQEYELCDNIDLDIILQDYCNYYLCRFDKQPLFCRRAAERPPARRPPRRPARVEAPPATIEPDLPAALAVTKLLSTEPTIEDTSIPALERKPLSGLLATVPADRRPLLEQVYQDIVRPAGVSWDDVKGLAEAKSLLMESIVYPVKYPSMFTGLVEPWRGLLLHGAPGTGKTLLARAAAAQSSCTFFNVSCSTLVHKWRGDSEKIVKALFEMASYYAPSIVFVDEVESLASERATPGEHEASRRLKSQLLTELDGVAARQGIVFLLANSNMPWEIDPAMLRRLEKRIYIPLPDVGTRTELFQKYLNSSTTRYPAEELRALAETTEGYSGSDIKLVCKEAHMAAVRKMLPHVAGRSKEPGRYERLDLADVVAAIQKTRPISKHLAQRHIDWQNQMGCS